MTWGTRPRKATRAADDIQVWHMATNWIFEDTPYKCNLYNYQIKGLLYLKEDT